MTTFTTFISPVLSLTTLSTRCSSLLCYYRLFSMHLPYYSFVLFLASAFLLQSTTFCSSLSHGSAHHTSPHHTASQQYLYLNSTTFAAALLFTCSRSLRFRSLFLLLFVLLSGDIELNPGPSPFTPCTLNIRSILHPLHSAALSDLIDTHNPDLFCLTETWIKPTTTTAELLNCTPTHYSLISTPRNGSDKITPQLSLSANLSHSYPPLSQIFRRSSHLLSLCNFLILSYQSSISIVLHLRPVILNHSLSSSMTSVLFCPPLQPHRTP